VSRWLLRSSSIFPKWLRPLATALLGLLATPTLPAIDPNRNVSQYVRQRWGAESGLPKGPVYAIHQTPDGYLWIGTERGLYRFDGVRFASISPGNPELSALGHVLGLTVDNAGDLWARLRRPTLLSYKRGVFTDGMAQAGKQSATTTAIARAHDGSLLIWALQGEGSARVLRGGKMVTVAAPVGFSRSPVLALAQTPDGDIWVGTRDAGLFRLRGNETTAVRENLPDRKVNAIVSAGQGQLWIGTDAGIVRWDGKRLTQAGVPPPLDSVQALSLAVDRDANLWVGTNSRGLIRLSRFGIASPLDPGAESHDAVTAIFEDREGNIWTGNGGGLESLRDSTFVTYSLPEGVPSDGSNPIFAAADGRVWFAPVQGGLMGVKDSQHRKIVQDGLGRDLVYSIAGGDGELWAGRQNGGLTLLRGEGNSMTSRTFTKADGLAQDSVYSVYRSRDGTVWAGTLSGGISKLTNGRFTNYTIADGLISNTVNAILETSAGIIWIGGPLGLSRFSQGRWDRHPTADVNCLLEDSTGVLWIGTAAGLSFRSKDRLQSTSGAPAALREPVLGLAEDKSGALWVSTANRVLRVNREKLQRGTLAEADLHEYGLADGLRGTEGVKRFRSVMADPAGRIWFSLNRGISVVDPGRVGSEKAPAIAQIQSIAADGNPVPIQAATRIPGGHRRLAFGFAGLSFSGPERVRFRYRLDNFDGDWTEPVAVREAVYTNLGPGEYRFRVIASNPEGVWSPTEAVVRFEVEPLVWQTWWFRTGLLLGLGLAMLALYRYRLHQVTRRMNVRFEERLAERTRIAQELHDTLLQGFLSASMQVHVATDQLSDDSRAKPVLTRALQLMDQVIDEGRNAVRGLRSSKSVSLDLEKAFSRVPQEMALAENNQSAFRVTVEGAPRPLHPLLRDEVYRIGREALINAFRHSRAKNVDMEIQYGAADLRVVVRDDGRGIDPKIVASGRDGHWGLSGMSERAHRIGAKFAVRSRAAAGTEVELAVPSRIAFADHGKPKWRWFGSRSGPGPS
jgi:ligand-binding sensor domain-containing protein/signal transduction histidine kinase